MDPITAIINLVIKILDLHLANLAAMPEDAKAEYGRMVVEDIRAWRNFLNLFAPKG